MYRRSSARSRACAASSCCAVVAARRLDRCRRAIADGRRCGRRDLHVRDLPLEQQPPLAIAVDRLAQRLQLQLRALDRLQVRLQLGRQLPRIRAAGTPRASSRARAAAARIFELRLEELVRALGLDLAVAQVLLDEQRRQPLGDLLRGPRLTAR